MTDPNYKFQITLTEKANANLLLQEGHVVKHEGREVQWFYTKNDAIAFARHTYNIDYFYNLSKHPEISIEKFGERKAKVGDVVIYDGKNGYYSAGIGYIAYDTPTIMFNAYGLYRNNLGNCDFSGGPFITTKFEHLVSAGLWEVTFWQFKDHPMPHQGVYYKMTVPMWRWGGEDK